MLYPRWIHADYSQPPSPPFMVPRSLFPEDSMIFFHGLKGGCLVLQCPRSSFFDLSKEECTICFLLVIRDLPQSPAPFKHARKGCQKDIGQLSAPTDAARWVPQACVGWVLSGNHWDLVLIQDWWFCFLNLICKHRGLWEGNAGEGWDRESNRVPQPYRCSLSIIHPSHSATVPHFLVQPFTADVVTEAPVVVFDISCKSELQLSFGPPDTTPPWSFCVHSL